MYIVWWRWVCIYIFDSWMLALHHRNAFWGDGLLMISNTKTEVSKRIPTIMPLPLNQLRFALHFFLPPSRMSISLSIVCVRFLMADMIQ